MDQTNDFPTDDMELTTILVVKNLEKSKEFYSKVLGAKFFREYGSTSAVYKFQNNWILIVTAGEATPDKPNITFTPPKEPQTVSHSFTIRVKDCQKSYNVLVNRGATFLTPPYEWESEVRCFFTDPDGHLFEISEYKE